MEVLKVLVEAVLHSKAATQEVELQVLSCAAETAQARTNVHEAEKELLRAGGALPGVAGEGHAQEANTNAPSPIPASIKDGEEGGRKGWCELVVCGGGIKKGQRLLPGWRARLVCAHSEVIGGTGRQVRLGSGQGVLAAASGGPRWV